MSDKLTPSESFGPRETDEMASYESFPRQVIAYGLTAVVQSRLKRLNRTSLFPITKNVNNARERERLGGKSSVVNSWPCDRRAGPSESGERDNWSKETTLAYASLKRKSRERAANYRMHISARWAV